MINTFCVAYKLKTHIFEAGTNKKNDNNIGRFPGGGLENQNPARTIAHSPPGVKETLNYMLREHKQTQMKETKEQQKHIDINERNEGTTK